MPTAVNKGFLQMFPKVTKVDSTCHDDEDWTMCFENDFHRPISRAEEVDFPELAEEKHLHFISLPLVLEISTVSCHECD